ncbi:MAG: hypothetical protein PHS37_04055 [Candidatus Omnitrophica bacterium]|nr:hypothetical protein [Candidatus Omnitrophota bacterium]
MRIALFNNASRHKPCINKDFMGGYGWSFNAGRSWPARLINQVKKTG